MRGWVVVRRRCRMQDHWRLQTSTLAIHTNDHPDVPTPQFVYWRLHLPTCQLGLQQNIPWRYESGLLGNIQQPWTAVWPKGSSQFLFSLMQRRHKPGPGLCEFRPEQPTAGQTCSKNVPAVTTSALPHNTPPRFKVPAHSDPVKRWNFCKADWKHFCLTGESVERLPPPDTTNIEKAYQKFCESLLSVAKQCIPRGRRKKFLLRTMWHFGTECETVYSPFIRAPVGKSHCVPTFRLEKKKQERWEEAVNSIDFSHSSRKAWSAINKLTGRSGRSSRFYPVSANSIAPN